jgi:hypothetical protein
LRYSIVNKDQVEKEKQGFRILAQENIRNEEGIKRS